VLQSNSASIENANRLHAGAIEFGFMASNWVGRAKNGEAPFAQPIDIRMAAPMNAGPLFLHHARTGADPLGRRTARPPRRGRHGDERHGAACAQHLRRAGLELCRFTPVYLDFAAGADALASGAVDAQFQCPLPNKVMSELAARVPLRVLPYAPDALAALLKTVRITGRRLSARARSGARPGRGAGRGGQHSRDPCTDIRAGGARGRRGRSWRARRSSVGSIRCFAALADLLAPLRAQGPAALEFGGVALHPGALAAYREADCWRDQHDMHKVRCMAC